MVEIYTLKFARTSFFLYIFMPAKFLGHLFVIPTKSIATLGLMFLGERKNIPIRRQCSFENQSSDVWMVQSYIGTESGNDFSFPFPFPVQLYLRCKNWSNIGAELWSQPLDVWLLQCMASSPTYDWRGMLQWSPTWVFFRLPRCQRIGTNIQSLFLEKIKLPKLNELMCMVTLNANYLLPAAIFQKLATFSIFFCVI